MCECRDCDNFKAKKREFKVGDKVNCVSGNGEVVTINVWHSYLDGHRYDRKCVHIALGNGGFMALYADAESISLID